MGIVSGIKSPPLVRTPPPLTGFTLIGALFTTQTLTIRRLCCHSSQSWQGKGRWGINWDTFYFSKYINSHDSFYWQIFHEPLTLDIFMHIKAHLCDLRLYKRTFHESFYTLAIITTKHEADNRVDSTVSVYQKVGYIKVYLETTREMGRTVLILYD